MSTEVQKRFLHWVRERHQIYLRRKNGYPPPWTTDPILTSVFFTNPYREHDKTTIWFKDYTRQPLMENKSCLFATIAFRWFNLPSTGEILLGENYLHDWEDTWPRTNLLTDWDLNTAMYRLKAWQNAGNKIFTGAFNISNSGSTKDKISRVCEDYLQPAWEACGPDGWMCKDLWNRSYEGKLTLALLHEFLSSLPGFGGSGFMCAQVVCDLKYTRFASSAPDWWTWCSPGPGSIKGLNRFLGRPVDSPKAKDFLDQVNHIRELLGKVLSRYPRFHAQDVQNCLCEFDKYEEAKEGGRVKRKYHVHY